jgi:hypothetical protein
MGPLKKAAFFQVQRKLKFNLREYIEYLSELSASGGVNICFENFA